MIPEPDELASEDDAEDDDEDELAASVLELDASVELELEASLEELLAPPWPPAPPIDAVLVPLVLMRSPVDEPPPMPVPVVPVPLDIAEPVPVAPVVPTPVPVAAFVTEVDAPASYVGGSGCGLKMQLAINSALASGTAPRRKPRRRPRAFRSPFLDFAMCLAPASSAL